MKLKAKYRFCSTTVVLFHILHCLNKRCIFFKDLLPHKISRFYTNLLVLVPVFLTLNKL